MATWKNKASWKSYGGNRYSGKSQNGHQGDRVSPTEYSMHAGKFGLVPVPNGGKFCPDVPNLLMNYLVEGGPSNFPYARNKSWASMNNKIHENSAALGVTLAEFREGLGMVVARSSQLFRGYRALRHGDFRGFLKTFGIGPKRKHKNTTKIRNAASQAGSLWLEYSFGWKPMVQDIWSVGEAMEQPLPGGLVRGSGRERFSQHNDYYLSQDFEGMVVVVQGCHVVISNPNLYLLQQMGVANPLSIAWELVPFSFVVDWFTDMGSFFGAATDLLGCDTSNEWTTVFGRQYGSENLDWNVPKEIKSFGFSSAMKRTKGLSYPLPNFSIRSNLGTSLTRAANAVSLLAQFMGK